MKDERPFHERVLAWLISDGRPVVNGLLEGLDPHQWVVVIAETSGTDALSRDLRGAHPRLLFGRALVMGVALDIHLRERFELTAKRFPLLSSSLTLLRMAKVMRAPHPDATRFVIGAAGTLATGLIALPPASAEVPAPTEDAS